MAVGDRELLERFDEAPEEAAREIFFAHFERIEKSIRSRLCLHGLNYAPESEHFNTVFEYVYGRVYSPESLDRALRDFDPEIGSLSGWLSNRVDFAVRDWLKQVKKTSQQTSAADPPLEPAAPLPQPEQTGCLERVIPKLTAKQRAAVTLRLYPSRPLSGEDRRVLCEIIGLGEAELNDELAKLDPAAAAGEIGSREEELVSQMSLWATRQQREERRCRWWRDQLLEAGLDETELDLLAHEATELTQDEIRAHYQASGDGTPDAERIRMRRQFALAAHEIDRCRKRLEQLRKGYRGTPLLALLDYESIAGLLKCTPQQVSANLHRARRPIEEECG